MDDVSPRERCGKCGAPFERFRLDDDGDATVTGCRNCLGERAIAALRAMRDAVIRMAQEQRP